MGCSLLSHNQRELFELLEHSSEEGWGLVGAWPCPRHYEDEVALWCE